VKRVVCIVLVLAACHGRKPKLRGPLRPLEVGTFAGYTIAPCEAGGHVVKLVTEPDERGEANNPHFVIKYRDRYLLPKLVGFDIKGWKYDSACAKSGTTIEMPEAQAGEALHRIGETLKANPTDIEVVVVPSKP
jgi:hypothetical protein